MDIVRQRPYQCGQSGLFHGRGISKPDQYWRIWQVYLHLGSKSPPSKGQAPTSFGNADNNTIEDSRLTTNRQGQYLSHGSSGIKSPTKRKDSSEVRRVIMLILPNRVYFAIFVHMWQRIFNESCQCVHQKTRARYY